jgi:hypothetical protein
LCFFFLLFFFDLCGCPGQLARTTTNLTVHWTPCKPSGHVRHHEGDKYAHESSNSGAAEGDKPLSPPGQDPQCFFSYYYYYYNVPACLGAPRWKPCSLHINWTVKWVSYNTNIQPPRKDLNDWIALMLYTRRIWHGFLGLANQEKMAVVSILLLSRFSGCIISKSQVLLFF